MVIFGTFVTTAALLIAFLIGAVSELGSLAAQGLVKMFHAAHHKKQEPEVKAIPVEEMEVEISAPSQIMEMH